MPGRRGLLFENGECSVIGGCSVGDRGKGGLVSK